jgi:serine/threonine protein kinase
MGQVFEAVHDQMKRRAAIKILHKRFANNRQIATRFLNEAKATSIVEHPGIVHIYEFGQTDDGTAYIVMEYLSGETLRQRLDAQGGKLPPEAVMRLGRQMASALQAAHEKGIVHRE